MWSRLRFRSLQALVLLALSALVALIAGLGPLYQRATEQALARDLMEQADPQQRSLVLTSLGPGAYRVPVLEAELPDGVRRFVGDPTTTTSVNVRQQLDGNERPAGDLVAPDDVCGHLVFAEGRCPDGPFEVAVTAADESDYGISLGSVVPVEEQLDPTDFTGPPGKAQLSVVGVYDAAPDDPYLAMPSTGGTRSVDGDVVSDDWVVTPETLAGDGSGWAAPTYEVAWPVGATAADADDLGELGERVQQLTTDLQTRGAETRVSLRVASGLPTLAAELAEGRDQGRATVTAFMLQLVVLALVVLWLVVGAAVEQRRPEIALALLRGRGSRGAARLLLGELLPVTVVGVALGGVGAVGASALLAHAVLPVTVPIELRRPFLLAWLGAAVAVMGVVLLAVRLAVREPVSSLLRRVAARGSGRASGVAEVAVIAVCVTAVGAFLSGNLRGPLAVVSPALLALAVALVVARLVAPAAGRLARRLLDRGRVVAGIGLLQVARRSDVRRVLVLATVATALLVFSLEAISVGARNRGSAAEQAAGAAEVVTVDSSRVSDVLTALDTVDPDRRHLTVVTRLTPTGDTDAPTVGVEPRAFARIALFPGQDPERAAWDRILAPDVAPLEVTGARLTGRLRVLEAKQSGPSAGAQTATLALLVTASDGLTHPVVLGTIDPRRPLVDVDAELPCGSGCAVTGLRVATGPGLSVTGRFALGSLATDTDARLDLGDAADWTDAGAPDEGRLTAFDPTSDPELDDAFAPGDTALGGRFVADTGSGATMTQAWLAPRVPALVAGAESEDFLASGLDGETQPMRAAGRLVRVPGSSSRARVVDVANLLRQGRATDPDLVVEVWSDTADLEGTGQLARLGRALGEEQIGIEGTRTLTSVRATLDRSTPTWSLTLGAVAAGVALLIAMLVLLVVASTTWRQRARDLAALRMTGVDRRTVRGISVLEQLTAVVLGVTLGAVCGVVGAHYALPSVTLFATPPRVSTLDLSTPWSLVAVVVLVTLMVLGAVAVASGVWLVRRARLATVREVL